MGCVTTKESQAELKSNQKDKNYLEEEREIKNKPNASPRVNGSHLPQTVAERPEAEPLTEREEKLNESGKPEWDVPQFLELPKEDQKHIQNSPIQIIYSSDHEFLPDHPQPISKDLFNAKGLEQEVIHEVSQEYFDSRLIDGDGKSNSINTKKQGNSVKIGNILQDVVLENHEKVDLKMGEEQFVLPFELFLPRIELAPQPVSA